VIILESQEIIRSQNTSQMADYQHIWSFRSGTI